MSQRKVFGRREVKLNVLVIFEMRSDGVYVKRKRARGGANKLSFLELWSMAKPQPEFAFADARREKFRQRAAKPKAAPSTVLAPSGKARRASGKQSDQPAAPSAP